MSKGRSTRVVGIRLPDSVYATLKERAKGISVSEYLKQQILKSVQSVEGNDSRPKYKTIGGTRFKVENT